MFRTIAMAAIASLALAGCIKHEPYYRPEQGGENGGHNGGHNGGNTVEQLALHERTDWTIRYVAREDWTNDDGSVDIVEHFRFAYKGNGYYIVRMITKENYEGVYEKNVASFFEYEAECLVEDAKNDGVNFWQYTDEVFDSSITDIYFNRLRSNTWIAYLIELDSNGKATGNYAETTFELRQEPASESFSKWLGDWLVTNGRVGYDLTISSIDNNFLYRIDGWECGQGAAFQMDQEYLEGEFYSPNGFLYIRSQFLGSYDDDNLGTVDELFMGNIFDSNGLTIITDEGIDLAVMVPQGEGVAELQPMEVTIATDSGDYKTKFHSMQYYMWAHSDSSWHPYNSNVAALPLTMTRQPGTKAGGVPLAKERTATKASIHHSQPKAGRSSRNSVAKKAVRMK